jgi:hypothetical protein
MIISEDDLNNFEKNYCELIETNYWWGDENWIIFLKWLFCNPQILFATDYTDYTYLKKMDNIVPELLTHCILPRCQPVLRNTKGIWVTPCLFGKDKTDKWEWFQFNNLLKIEKLYQDLNKFGEYWGLQGISIEILERYAAGEKDEYLDRINIPNTKLEEIIEIKKYYKERYSLDFLDLCQSEINWIAADILKENMLEMTTFEEIYKRMKLYINNPLLNDRSIISPKIWTPDSNNNKYKTIFKTASNIIHEIQEEKKELNDITPKQLEDIVAELFRNMDMEIYINKEHPQGGRDIIGRLCIGYETVNIAIEVKHRKLVDTPLLANFQKQNEQFPLLYLVTSGRFSAGVINEALKNENRMRLKLYDGVALKSLIQLYGLN